MKTIGQVAYETYIMMYRGGYTPTWNQAESQIKEAWENIAESVVKHRMTIPTGLPPLTPTTTVLADVPMDKVCPECNGEGRKWASIEICLTCQGKGYFQ